MAAKAEEKKTAASSSSSSSSTAAAETKKPAFQPNPAHLDGVADMSSLIYLEGDNVLHNLACRYRKDEIYTSISKVLIAINPYQDVDIYAPRVIKQYRRGANKRNNDLPPHVFSVSQAAKYNLMATLTNQSMIVCGESGSGKTESAKHLMRYLAYTEADAKADEKEEEKEKKDDEKKETKESATSGGKRVSIEKQVLDANPILESFGNAKTVLNNNSSRFGKFTKLVFTQTEVKEMTEETYCANPNRKGCPIIEARIVGSFIETYLLEKSRVVQQDLGERNYHIFYELCAGGLETDLFTAWKLGVPETFHYLRQSKCVTVDGQSDPDRLIELRTAMETLRFSREEQNDMFKLVAGILHLGNVNFIGMGASGPSRDGGANDPAHIHPKHKDSVANAAELFGVELKGFTTRLTTRNMTVRSQVITKPLSKFEAEQNRDAMSKALYSSLFNFIVSRINDELFLVKARQDGLKWIGILDVFGFESFEHNSFEQFCINFCNERLQQYFNRYILKSEQDEYILEAIMWTPISVPDNQDTIDLVDKKTTGILAVLDSACKMPKGDDKAFVGNLMNLHPKHPRLTLVERIRKPGVTGLVLINGFSIAHYAGTVIYNAKEFLSKNADFTSPDTIALFAASRSPIGRLILAETDEKAAPIGGRPAATPAGAGGGAAATAFKSTGAVFSTQLNSLMQTLYDTTPHFVRCIKPNKQKKPGNFTWDYVRPQLECGGIIDALRILKCGYPTRCAYENLFSRYGKILVPTPPNLNKRDFCEAILRTCGETLDRKEFQLGLTKVFFRPGKQAFLEGLLEDGYEIPARTVKMIRRFLLNKRFFRVRGGIRVFLRFDKMLRRMRALRWVIRTFRVANVICGTMFASLLRARKRINAVVLQSAARSAIDRRRFLRVKLASVTIATFYKHNKQRKPLAREIHKRILKKRSLVTEKERKEKEQREIQRRERERLEKEMRLLAEKKRREDEESGRTRAAELAAEALRQKKLQEEREAERERVERENRMAELQRMADEAKELRARQELMERDAAKEKEEREREREAQERARQAEREARERQAALEREEAERAVARAAEEARERERVLFEARLNDMQEKQKAWEEERNADVMQRLVTKGQTFSLLLNQSGSAPPLFTHPAASTDRPPVVILVLSEDGVLSWKNADEKSSARAQTDGSSSLREITDVVCPGAPNPLGAVPSGVGLNKQIIVSTRSGGRLTVEASTSEVCNEWCTGLRYVIRNHRELNTISRPQGDPARGNVRIAQLADRVASLQQWVSVTSEQERKDKEAARIERETLRAQFDATVRDKEQTVKERDEWKDKHSSLSEEEKRARRDAEDAAQQLREAKRGTTDLKEALATAEKKVRESAEVMVKSAGDFSGMLQDQSARMKKEVEEREADIASLKAKMREAEDDAMRRRGEAERERKEVEERHRAALADRDREASGVREERNKLADEVASLRGKVAETTREASEIKTKYAEVFQELLQAKGGRQALEEERARSEKRMAELTEGLETIRLEMGIIRKDADEKTKALSEAAARERALASERAAEREDMERQQQAALTTMREQERLATEARVRDAEAKQKAWEDEQNADEMAARLVKGTPFTILLHHPVPSDKPLYQAAFGPKPTVILSLNDEGVLNWVHKDQKSPLREQTNGTLSLNDLNAVLTPGHPDPLGEAIPGPGLDRQFILVSRTGGKYTFETHSYEQCDEWAMSLRYVLRNWRALNTISPPPGDNARNNMLCARLAYRAEALDAYRLRHSESADKDREAIARIETEWKTRAAEAIKANHALTLEKEDWKAKYNEQAESERKARRALEELEQQGREKERKVSDLADALAAAEKKARESVELMMKNAGDFSGTMQEYGTTLKREVGEREAQIATLKAKVREQEDDATRRASEEARERKELEAKTRALLADKEREIGALGEEKARFGEDRTRYLGEVTVLRTKLEETQRQCAELNTEVQLTKAGRQALEEERIRTERRVEEERVRQERRWEEERARAEKRQQEMTDALGVLRKEIVVQTKEAENSRKQLADVRSGTSSSASIQPYGSSSSSVRASAPSASGSSTASMQPFSAPADAPRVMIHRRQPTQGPGSTAPGSSASAPGGPGGPGAYAARPYNADASKREEDDRSGRHHPSTSAADRNMQLAKDMERATLGGAAFTSPARPLDRKESSAALTLTPQATAQVNELSRKLEESKAAVADANVKAADAERDLDRRKESIKSAMRAQQEQEKKLKDAEQTMKLTGIEGKTREDVKNDPTAMRWLEIHIKQQEACAEAKAALLREYASMVHEAEALNVSRDELAKRQGIAARYQTDLDRVRGGGGSAKKAPAPTGSSTAGGGGGAGAGAGAASATRKPAASTSAAGAGAGASAAHHGPTRPGEAAAPTSTQRVEIAHMTAEQIMAASAAHAAATADGKGGDKKDDGCVIA